MKTSRYEAARYIVKLMGTGLFFRQVCRTIDSTRWGDTHGVLVTLHPVKPGFRGFREVTPTLKFYKDGRKRDWCETRFVVKAMLDDRIITDKDHEAERLREESFAARKQDFLVRKAAKGKAVYDEWIKEFLYDRCDYCI